MYAVVEAQRSDVPELTSTFLDAFRDDPMLGQIWPNVRPDVSHAYHARRFAVSFENTERSGVVWRKVVEKESRYAVPSSRLSHSSNASQMSSKDPH